MQKFRIYFNKIAIKIIVQFNKGREGILKIFENGECC